MHRQNLFGFLLHHTRHWQSWQEGGTQSPMDFYGMKKGPFSRIHLSDCKHAEEAEYVECEEEVEEVVDLSALLTTSLTLCSSAGCL